jgi:DNA-binding HxlR family transcriptional regulator
MKTKRSYGETCAAAHALDLIGQRWALLVVRELVLGPKRFTDLQAGIPHASPNVLAERLRELEGAGVVVRRKLPPPAGSWVYELTEWGAELEQVICDLGRWGARSPLRPREGAMSIDALILALRTMFDPDLAGDLSATLDLRLADDRFRIRVADGSLEISRGEVDDPDAVLTIDPRTLVEVAFEGASLGEALASGAVAIEGDRPAVERFLGSFALPEPVEPRLPVGVA